MANALPILLLGGAAVMLMAGGKKKKKAPGIALPGLTRREAPRVQVRVGGMKMDSGTSPIPEAMEEMPLEPFDSIAQVQEALIAAGYQLPKYGADGGWGGESKAAMKRFQRDNGFTSEASAGVVTPETLRALHVKAYEGTNEGRLANPQTGAGTALYCDPLLQDCPEGQACFATDDEFLCLPTIEEEVVKYTPEEYAPGGFREVYFSPDYGSMEIGGGWKFSVLEPWLYERMKSGKLLTYALKGSLAWEDAIISNPKAFWSATLASAGLATATVGTKGWLDFRKTLTKIPPVRLQFAQGLRYSRGSYYITDPQTGRLKFFDYGEWEKHGWRAYTEYVDTAMGKQSVHMLRHHNPRYAEKAIAIGVPLIYGAIIVGLVWGTGKVTSLLADKQRDLIAESAILAWQDFAKSHKVRVGNGRVLISDLPEVMPVQIFQAYVATQIVRFQKSNYE